MNAQLELFPASPQGPQGLERTIVRRTLRPSVLKKRKLNWNSLNQDNSKFPYYSKTTGYLIEHASPTFERWLGLEEIEFVDDQKL